MNKSDNVILVTGGAGFVGSNLVRLLVAEGNVVIVVDDLSSGRKSNIADIDNVIFINGVLQDRSILDKAFSYSPSYVFHLAALFANQNSVDNPLNDLDTNGKATLMLLEYCVQHDIKKIVYTSSSCVYGNLSEKMNEEVVGYLETPYAITKLLGEHYLRFYSDQYGLNSIAIRVFNTFGPFDYPGEYRSVIPNFFEMALNRKPLIVHGDGKSTRCYLYVDDLVCGLVKSMRISSINKFSILNIGNDQQVSSMDLALLINDITGNDSGVKLVPNRNWDYVQNRVPDIQKCYDQLGWRPIVTLKEGINRYHKWFLDLATH